MKNIACDEHRAFKDKHSKEQMQARKQIDAVWSHMKKHKQTHKYLPVS